MTEPAETTEAPESSNAMSWPSVEDIPDTVMEPEAETPETPETPDPEAPETPETPAEETTPPETPEVPETPAPERVETFDREYVEKLRSEAAEQRVRAKEVNEAFEGFDEGTRQQFLDMARGLNDETRHVEVAQQFYDVAKRIFDHYGIETPEMAPDPNKPLTPAQLEARLKQEREERDNEARVAQIAKEVEDLGYVPGEGAHYALLRIAYDRDISLSEAHEQLKGEQAVHAREWIKSDDEQAAALRKSIVDEFIAAHQAKQERHLDTAPQVGVAPKEEREAEPTTFEDARRLMSQRFADQGA